ncbi:MAG: hypothetical protein A2X25_00100 [Chloroflexi bacterium GWB2_49_20]|nr:MAG: hypothetical protein A2X25_00100 [Chloroflexi bacterium GWB2_49_20]OGN76931.1 MAG: hypothetical protein A2X26_13465 [Chloroflexi bacterium GWC2_49_37]OGN84873.1 MAG: hypothetical protein A2X27_14990 [Chloroflexi bacterium GWD2_49_16]HCM96577.1 hypothetical protein [Anaerolineae bacterium]
MPVRLLDFLDLPNLYKYRHRVIPLDSARAATRGNLMGLNAMLSYLNPRREISTAIHQQDDGILLGQVTHSSGSPHANLAFLAPDESTELAQAALLDFLSVQAGEWGCLYLLAEVDECSPAFKALRQAGFSMYAWQRVWKMNDLLEPGGENLWKGSDETDLIAIQSLYAQIVPAMLQPVEPLPRHPEGLVCRQAGDLQAYISLIYGPAGIWVQPLIHPDATCLPERMTALLTSIPNRRNRPVYVCVRSYQAWLESMLEELGASAGERQAVMIRHLAVRKWVEEALPAKKAEPAWANPATPVVRINHTDSE